MLVYRVALDWTVCVCVCHWNANLVAAKWLRATHLVYSATHDPQFENPCSTASSNFKLVFNTVIFYTYTLPFKSIFKEVSYAHQSSIYLNENTVILLCIIITS